MCIIIRIFRYEINKSIFLYYFLVGFLALFIVFSLCGLLLFKYNLPILSNSISISNEKLLYKHCLITSN